MPLPNDTDLEGEDKAIAALIFKLTTHLDSEPQKEAMRSLLWKHGAIFYEQVGVARVPPVRLPVTADAPLSESYRRLNPNMQKEVNILIETTIKANFVSPAIILSPIMIVMVRKK